VKVAAVRVLGSADRRFCGPRFLRTPLGTAADRKTGGPRYPAL